MEQVLKSPHLWLILLIATCIQAFYFRVAAREHIRQQPELAEGYAALSRGWLLWGNLPWLVMGFGLEFGGVPSFWHYLRPRDGNVFVLAWYACVVALWILGFWWIWLRSGADVLARHSRIFRGPITTPARVKLFYLICVGGGIAGFIFLFLMDVPIPVGGFYPSDEPNTREMSLVFGVCTSSSVFNSGNTTSTKSAHLNLHSRTIQKGQEEEGHGPYISQRR